MTRKEAARQLGITRGALIGLERDGTATPELGARRVPAYTADEVERLRGVIAAAPIETNIARARKRRSARGGTAREPSSAPSGGRALLVRSESTMALVDEAEQLEAAARVALAEQRLATLQGEEQARLRELDDLRARDEARTAAAAAMQEQHRWRLDRIRQVLAPLCVMLRDAGHEHEAIAYGLMVAEAVLKAQPDFVIAGVNYAGWLAHTIVADALRFDRPELPFVPTITMGPDGPSGTWRQLQPGD